MARLAGQIDIAKSEAILDAAMEVWSRRGFAAPMEEIARCAGVSKQTIYNRYGSKAELVRALADKKVGQMTASLETEAGMENPAEALADFARVLLGSIATPSAYNIYRMAVLNAPEMPDVARAMYEAGPKTSRERLAEFLALETQAGRLDCPRPLEAAEFFGGMVIGSFQTRMLLGVDSALDDDVREHIVAEAARRFLRAYAP